MSRARLVAPEGAECDGSEDELVPEASPRLLPELLRLLRPRRAVVGGIAATLAVAALIGIHLRNQTPRDGLRSHSFRVSSDFMNLETMELCPVGTQNLAGCTEDGHPDNDCCSMSGHGGCQFGQPTIGGVCHENGAVATCCGPHPAPSPPPAPPAPVSLCPDDLVQHGCLENGVPDPDCCALADMAGCELGSASVVGQVCHESGAVATCCPKPELVPLGNAPFCPDGFLRAGCLAHGQVDYSCCARPGAASCAVGSAATQGQVCNVDGSVATCCPPPTLPAADDNNLFCFIVSRNSGGEADLTRSHYWHKRSAFACNEWQVFSDAPMNGVPSTVIGSFESQRAYWGSWANTRVFLRAWTFVLAENKWARHGWTVKADSDSVFYPERLRWHLKGFATNTPLYVRNTGKEYLGPIEVLNAAAVQKFGEGRSDHCMSWLDNSPEDGWIDKCLKSLGVPSHFDNDLLVSSTNPWQCHNGWVVTFHPFKSVGAWEACDNNARNAHR